MEPIFWPMWSLALSFKTQARTLLFTHRSKHALALSDGAAAAQEPNHHDDDTSNDEHIGPRVERAERIGTLNILPEVFVHAYPDSDSEKSTSHQLEKEIKS